MEDTSNSKIQKINFNNEEYNILMTAEERLMFNSMMKDKIKIELGIYDFLIALKRREKESK